MAISIHALLAESDTIPSGGHINKTDFYPRSPCGERRRCCAALSAAVTISIHALLAESDNFRRSIKRAICNFYPRSPCGERQAKAKANENRYKFLSTLSLRRATEQAPYRVVKTQISIHALLAESDPKWFSDALEHLHFYPRSPCGERRLNIFRQALAFYFYPRSPCGERPSTYMYGILYL